MQNITIKFSSGSTQFLFGSKFTALKKLVVPVSTILITDENVFRNHRNKFRGWNCIVLKAGEDFKVQETVDAVIEQMIAMEADRNFTLVGIGGGVITDITGYVASIYMRGIRFGYVPTTILGLVDASIGGKNGVDVGIFKNMVGTIRQPAFILHDLSFLETLPDREWKNGFAEIIKHACIADSTMFRQLEQKDLAYYRRNKKAVLELIRRNAGIKIRVVKQDEFEKAGRKLLNFGHTLGHALENQYELLHGEAISIGMCYASELSEQLLGFREKHRVIALLLKYGLPAYAAFNSRKVFDVLKMDKKRNRTALSYILLDQIGKATIYPVKISLIKKFIERTQK